MDYKQSRAYIDEAAKYGAVLGLDNMREMLKRLGNPQDSLSYVHVAGTNGKGSVIAYLYHTLTHAGYRVGRYISPTLYSYRERLEVAGERISHEEFANVITAISEVIHQMTKEGLPHPTPFEIETAAAFLYFKEQNCDLVLLEVGMGGNMDATNIIKNTRLAVLVSVSMDHMSFLGNTLGEIAEKKAGIIKPGCKVVTTKQQKEAEQVILSVCEKQGVPYVISDPSDNVFTGAECYAICEKENNVAIGAVELKLNGHTDMTDRDDECELGYWLGEPFWGRGYMPEAAYALMKRGFETLGMTAIWCGYYDGNEKSKRVQEKLGFIYHHTCDEVPVPLLNEVRVGHTNVITKEQWNSHSQPDGKR